MINAYVINMEKHFKRKTDLIDKIKTNQIDKYINFNFIKGVDGSNLNPEEKLSFKMCPYWISGLFRIAMTCGEVGCALSHYKAWCEFYDSNELYAIFLEDDINFITTNIEKNISVLLSYPPDADLVYIIREQAYSEEHVDINKYEYFQEIEASYAAGAYLLTRNGVEKIFKANYLDNLIVVDQFLPILYDPNYYINYKKYFNVTIQAYCLKNEYKFIDFIENSLYESSTFHSNYYEYDSQFIAFTSDKNIPFSSVDRFIKSCKKYSIQPKFIQMENIIEELDNIDKNKYIFLLNCNYCFFNKSPAKLIVENEKDYYFSSFTNYEIFLKNFESNSLYFFGKTNILVDILKNNKNSNICKNYDINDIVYDFLPGQDVFEKKNTIFVNGFNNKLLLDKFENYNINRILKSYGYQVINKKQIYNFKIRVNIMFYEYNNIECLNIFNNIDYPIEYLDINIYTLFDLEIDDNIYKKIKVYKKSELDSFKEIYEYYLDYDYIWIIYSNTNLTEPSILKDLIDSEKMIIAGLTLRPETSYSNFWGTIDKYGWYLRSNDYIDIISRNKINIWNVPFINGNILFNKKIFSSYNLIYDNTYNDLDMKICHNLRNYNEGMFLTNQRLYGYLL